VKPDSGLLDLERLRSTDAPELHHALDAMKQRLPDAQQLATLAASLSQMGISVAPSKQGAVSTGSSATRLKLLLGAGVVGPLTLVLLLWRSAAPHATAPTAIPSPATPAAVASEATPEAARRTAGASNGVNRLPGGSAASDVTPPSPATASSSPSAVVAPDKGPQPAANLGPIRSVARVAPAPTLAAESARSPVSPAAAERVVPESIGPGVVARPTEVALLRDARLALGSSPADALALAEQHRTLFPRGAMVQERELIAISALARLGRHTAVLTRAAQFEHDFPNSPYRKQVSALAQ